MCPKGPTPPGVGSQAHTHFVRYTTGQAGSSGGGAVWAVTPLNFSLLEPRGLVPWLSLRAAAPSQCSLVLYEHLHLVDQVPGNPQDLLGIVMLSPLVEELDDIGEVHVVVSDNLSVGLHQGQGNEQDEVL